MSESPATNGEEDFLDEAAAKKIVHENNPPPDSADLMGSSTGIASTNHEGIVWGLNRIRLLMHIVLMLAFTALAASYCLVSVHNDYFVPLVTRARRTDEDLDDEFTYYERTCSAEDVTISWEEEIPELIHGSDATKSASSLERMMKHGVLVFPELLSNSTIAGLRNFILDKNAAVSGTDAEFPVSQGHKRISYGIEATEDSFVIQALKEIHESKELTTLLEGLVGKNPALTEITAITASYGAQDQAWHADTKQDGNALKWSRTYSHSYSLFVALQDTTSAMGATHLCPGTHYCADSLDSVCEELRIGVNQIVEENNGIWKAGDAALLNQQMWHRGPKHNDRYASERVVFIVSFISRPIDTRQLSRGTYFHMKWNMWGHTLKDLGDSVISMARPFNILRCLHIWKPKNRDWGYDLIVATAMRVANNQLGCEPEDLEMLVRTLDRLGLPAWLHGTIDYESDEAWQIYISETIDNIFNFWVSLNKSMLSAYLGMSSLIAIGVQSCYKAGGTRVLLSAILGVCLTHVVVIFVMYWFLIGIQESDWAIGISSGRTLQRPFPPLDKVWSDDPYVSNGPITLPSRQDVLVGSRLDAKSIGAYNRLLDFHPGNAALRERINGVMMRGEHGANARSMYRSYEEGLPPIFYRWVLHSVLGDVQQREGRFLQQDYRTGDWRHMNRRESLEYARLILASGTHGLGAEVRREIDFLLAECRFGILRGTIMAKMSQIHLHELARYLFGELPKEMARETRSKILLVRTPLRLIHSDDKRMKRQPLLGASYRWVRFPSHDLPVIRTGSNVLYIKEGDLFPATVVHDYGDDVFDIMFSGEIADDLGIGLSLVPLQSLRKIHPPFEGARVQANYIGQGEWFQGRITKLRPIGVDVSFDDGDFEDYVTPQRFAVISTLGSDEFDH